MLGSLLFTALLIVPTTTPIRVPVEDAKQVTGIASYYDYSLPGYPNYSKENYTAASRDFPRGTRLMVCTAGKSNLEPSYSPHNIQCVVVRVNDYGPTLETGRKIDLSSKSFSALRPLRQGLVDVTIEEVK